MDQGMRFSITRVPCKQIGENVSLFCSRSHRQLQTMSVVLRPKQIQSAIVAIVSRNLLQKYDIEFLLQQEWYDSRLRYPNQTTFSVLNGIHHQSDIWLPDTNFHMHGDFKPTQRPIRFTLHVYGDGRVEYTTRQSCRDTRTYTYKYRIGLC